MMARKFNYTAVDGNHWPDADVGDDLYYQLDISCWLNTEQDNLVSAAWILPEEITSSDEFIQGNAVGIKLATNSAGSFKCVCKITTEDAGKTQTNAIPMILKVFAN